MNIIKTKPIGQIIRNKQTPQRAERFEHFLIPYYQRGYRWNTEHIRALLEDIDNFLLSKEANYCLQPIVVAPATDQNGFNIWEVIDGQQRLISLYIIFQHIKKPRYSILFGQRTKSTAFLQNLSESTYDHNSPDFHFMSNSYKVVAEWFEKKSEDDISYIDEFYTVITKKVQVIWYQIQELSNLEEDLSVTEKEDKKIDIFNRLNIGKIPLTDAELIRALLLSKIKYGLTEREAILRQSEISNEWNLIEQELRKEDFWYFLNNHLEGNLSSRIEFIFKLIARENSKNYSTYLWFEKKLKGKEDALSESEIEGQQEVEERKNALELWERTKAVFAKFKSWFNNRSLYHYIGFLLADNYKIQTILEHSDTTKSAFKAWVKKEVKNSLKDIKLEVLNYEKDKKSIEKVLLLFNILTVENLCDSIQNRFPFNQYKSIQKNDGGWSIEHVHAQKSNAIKEDKVQKRWLEEALEVLKNINTLEMEQTDEEGKLSIKRKDISSIYTAQIQALLSKEAINNEVFNTLKDELIDLFESSSVHELDNLALLSKKDNSSLSNSIFPVKRNKIIQLEKEGKFIPPCTRNLFLKFYSNSDNQPYYWSTTDKQLYFKAIKETLSPFLT